MSAEPTRTMTLNYLLMMGIDITENDKISDERIAKRLLKALDCAQLASKWLSGPQLNPSQMEKWDDSESLNVALRRGNPVDGHRLARPDIEAKFKKPNAPINAFRDLRTSINQLGELWDKGQRVTRFRCEDKLYAITMRMVEVVKIKNKIPMIVLLYRATTPAEPSQDALDHMWKSVEDDPRSYSILASQSEQRILLKLLALNAARIHPAYRVSRELFEEGFGVSFLIPTGPLTMKDRASLNEDTGCVVCGNKTTKRCAGCELVKYCGAICQRKDWRTHKPKCMTLAKVKWHRFTFSPPSEENQAYYMNRYSRADDEDEDTIAAYLTRQEKGVPPPNNRADRPFLIKIQCNLSSILIYDRHRSTEFTMFRNESSDEDFMKLAQATWQENGHLKSYRWAKRISNWTLEICLDVQPPDEPEW
ncbi:hypothetical protein SISSUDRAFT_1132898 [Sistotremastrum suecicum HHB10207 ss-3]|uniref:MYND-type domain-containing protein n=1 Tax=Sistotremastrum suecicum HHB10207 ss-3 TaxID=1314776 RepID=A0A165Y4N9_9AGAM|nr:hypothetical protein SISSUDRAFT_1132898 [Sistotremastrum suecicum HHB10207 ss-3]